ncbi:non-symbiotic hemoglobin 1-like isoform X2 [Ischnura elegans]|uniref:non-symbiotic hemoglobin 1-like isoform X2 n=1 Tax=Ischnura elegans TaxID=197161 RepID=UPI001ED8A18D|nr:non-symbiotic hemoglobin 1-like isoform X2 [Ischnura elegans]
METASYRKWNGYPIKRRIHPIIIMPAISSWKDEWERKDSPGLRDLSFSLTGHRLNAWDWSSYVLPTHQKRPSGVSSHSFHFRLFETHPDVQEVFIPFQGMGLEELRHSKQLRAHALRVMGFVQKAVARLHEPEKLDVLLRELGKKHYSYGAKQQYIDYIAPEFIQAIKPSLEDKWSDEVEEAWIALFNYMGVIMKAAMDLEEQRAAAASLPPYKVSSSTNTSLPHASPGPLSFTPTKASRRSSDVVGGAGGGGGGIVGSSRRGTLF